MSVLLNEPDEFLDELVGILIKESHDAKAESDKAWLRGKVR